MAATTVFENLARNIFSFNEIKKINMRFCSTCKKSLSCAEYYRHNKSKNHSIKAGEKSKCEVSKKSV